jgi:hypothetical protein
MSCADTVARPLRTTAWRDWLALARVSNLPTVVSNTIAGAALAGAGGKTATIAVVAGAMALFYTAGMLANDVLDLEVDRRERPERPLPAGRISLRAAVVATVALFATGEALLLAVDAGAAVAGLGLIATILVYDAWHKGNALSPVLMGLCRGLVYVVAGLAVAGAVTGVAWGAAGLMLLYIVGLTQVAKAEGQGAAARWALVAVLAPAAVWARELPSVSVALLIVAFVAAAGHALWLAMHRHAIGPAVGHLIATVALLDALATAAVGGPTIAVLACLVAYVITLALQTKIAGT